MSETIERQDATKESIAAFMKENGLTLESVFVPWSRSRSFVDGTPAHKRNLNWKVTLKRNGRDVLTCDYSAGIGHAPSYSAKMMGRGFTVDDEAALLIETEQGFAASRIGDYADRKRPILPETASVLSSLAMDSDVLDYRSFEDWAPELGYDSDSRAAEKIYRACLEIALALRNGLGESLFAKLRDAVSGY